MLYELKPGRSKLEDKIKILQPHCNDKMHQNVQIMPVFKANLQHEQFLRYLSLMIQRKKYYKNTWRPGQTSITQFCQPLETKMFICDIPCIFEEIKSLSVSFDGIAIIYLGTTKMSTNTGISHAYHDTVTRPVVMLSQCSHVGMPHGMLHGLS